MEEFDADLGDTATAASAAKDFGYLCISDFILEIECKYSKTKGWMKMGPYHLELEQVRSGCAVRRVCGLRGTVTLNFIYCNISVLRSHTLHERHFRVSRQNSCLLIRYSLWIFVQGQVR